jgi:hypothetical protein
MSIKELQAVKDRLREAYLGKGGVHGLGVKPSQDAIQVYVGTNPAPDEAVVLDELRRVAAPHGVIVRREAGAIMH